MVFEDTGRCLRRTRSHLRPRGPDFPHISERFLQQNAASSKNSVLSGREGENEANNQEISVLSGPPLNSEQGTAVDFVSELQQREPSPSMTTLLPGQGTFH